MPLPLEVLEDLHKGALDALDRLKMATCGISDSMFSKVTPDLPFSETEVLQTVEYMQAVGLAASGLRLEKDGYTQLILLMSRSEETLQKAIAEMQREMMEVGTFVVLES
jgi:hypothetical protein